MIIWLWILYLANSVFVIKQDPPYHLSNLLQLCFISRLWCPQQLSSEGDHRDGDNVLILGQPGLHQGKESQCLVTRWWNDSDKMLPWIVLQQQAVTSLKRWHQVFVQIVHVSISMSLDLLCECVYSQLSLLTLNHSLMSNYINIYNLNVLGPDIWQIDDLLLSLMSLSVLVSDAPTICPWCELDIWHQGKYKLKYPALAPAWWQ